MLCRGAEYKVNTNQCFLFFFPVGEVDPSDPAKIEQIPLCRAKKHHLLLPNQINFFVP